MQTFTLEAEHIILLQTAEVEYQCDYGTGAAGIDQKRPYGNSAVEHDVEAILGEDCMRFHYETATALQVILDTMSFVLGEYQKVDGVWIRV